MPDTPTPALSPDMVDQPPLAGMSRIYGMWVTAVGEDGALLVAGHQPLMRAVAAMNRFSRTEFGLSDLVDGDGRYRLVDVAPDIRWRWATRLTVEDCSTRDTDLADGVDHGCEMCSALADGNWWIALHNTEQPGSFPITWMSA